MKTETIPDDVARFIQASIDRKKIELEKTTREKEKRNKERLAEEERARAEIKKILKSAKINLLNLERFIAREDVLKSYLDLQPTIAFPLWESGLLKSYHAYILLKSDGVYTRLGHEETWKDLKKITFGSIAKDALNCTNVSDLPDYIRSLERWNVENLVKYLKEQFTPI